MTIPGRIWTATLLGCAVLLGAAQGAAAQAGEAASDAAALQSFEQAVQGYEQLRARFEAPLPPLHSRGAWSTLITRRYLASALRAARRDARAGSIFTPSLAVIVRLRLAEALTPSERLLLAAGDDDESGVPIPLVNEPLATEWLTPLPAAATQQLPPLPVAIEYRLLGTTLVLWDSDAEIIIDVLPQAIN
jgi:hypothetical protein